MRELTFLPWDTELFGCRIARLDGEHHDAAELAPALDACRAEQIACAYLAVPAEALEAVRAAEDAGFRLVDQRLTLERRSSGAEPLVAEVRVACPADLPEMQAIAAVSHTDTRFYADPGLSRRRCEELYRIWITRSCQGYADVVLTEGPEGEPAGYITCHIDGGGAAARTGRIGLIAVGEAHQGRGVGGRLVAGALRWFAEAGLADVSVATQGRNVRAQRLYQGAGFRSQSMVLWYHTWFALAA